MRWLKVPGRVGGLHRAEGANIFEVLSKPATEGGFSSELPAE